MKSGLMSGHLGRAQGMLYFRRTGFRYMVACREAEREWREWRNSTPGYLRFRGALWHRRLESEINGRFRVRRRVGR